MPENVSTKVRHIGIYPGTFDPMHNGHIDIISRATRVLHRLVVGVAESVGKSPLFPLEERVELVRAEAAIIAERTSTEIQVVSFKCLCPQRQRGRDHPGATGGVGFRLRVPDGGDELPPGP
jgi:pantetheine-phosphate adenylyltransferase